MEKIKNSSIIYIFIMGLFLFACGEQSNSTKEETKKVEPADTGNKKMKEEPHPY